MRYFVLEFCKTTLINLTIRSLYYIIFNKFINIYIHNKHYTKIPKLLFKKKVKEILQKEPFFTSLGIGFINAILYYFQYRRNKIHIEKIRTKKRLFREWYERTKDLTDRMEIVDKKDISTHTVFNYKIKKKNGTDYEEPTTQFVLNVRINNVVEDIKSVCGIESKKFEGIEKENQGKIELNYNLKQLNIFIMDLIILFF